ncbi:bacillithiol biosynthesis deacetylase BshB2 [Terrilactibacillus laevilacticus]|uniref:bacillithiol biosynthesis deacetylase BshB2 n=1 Tax=Terrilactibacillus laevilacticus TaxID=1380157 RepID=UPI001146E8C7|nr:bacillithiol biosynthesis deacetylase BshB2 [Terrilactibacillus laevilacticus]
MNKKPILVIFPHPDDESFGVAGSLIQWSNQGIPITYLCLTLGEMGRNMGSPIFATRETLPIHRKQELQEASRLAGIKDLRMMGYHDKTIEFEDKDALADVFIHVIHELNPQLVITFYPGYSVHPDHDACGAAVVRALEKLPSQDRPLLHCVGFSHNIVDDLGKPDVIRDVSDVIDQKLAVLAAHTSQTAPIIKELKQNPSLQERFKTEEFWTYSFDQ